MPRIKQSFCYGLYLKAPVKLEQLLKEAAKIGYAAVELWGRQQAPFDELCDLARGNGLVVASMCGHASLPDGLNRRENHARIENELVESIEVAAKKGIPGLICFSGNRYYGRSDEECVDIVAEGLSRVKKAAEEKKVNLNLELLNSKVNHPGYQCDKTAWGAEVVRRVNSPNVKLLYDIYHMQIMEGDVIRTIRQNIKAIGHFHTAGNPDRRDMDDVQEMNYRGICKAIAQAGYELYVGHEFSPKGDAIAALRSAFEICDQE
jgi:hydroxypyruvate isomerase